MAQAEPADEHPQRECAAIATTRAPTRVSSARAGVHTFEVSRRAGTWPFDFGTHTGIRISHRLARRRLRSAHEVRERRP
ncbi:MAG TPA: hypothetical protein PLT83_05985, partial [Thermoleophilia bacterium]|nr:hypothetical protein [Thermoleophilia bacterium]